MARGNSFGMTPTGGVYWGGATFRNPLALSLARNEANCGNRVTVGDVPKTVSSLPGTPTIRNHSFMRPSPAAIPRAALVLFAAAAGTTAAFAQDPASDQLAALRACRAEADPAARLACFDAAASDIVSRADAGDLRVVDKAEIQRTRRGLFGFSLPDLGLFGGSDEPDMDMLETTITSVRYTGSDAFVFRTKEGATWQVSNVPSRLREARAGDAVVFKRAAMGSYFIRIGGQMGVKGKRID